MPKLSKDEIAMQLLTSQFETEKDFFGRMTTYSSFILFGFLSVDIFLSINLEPNILFWSAVVLMIISTALSGSAMFSSIAKQAAAIDLFIEGKSPKKILKKLQEGKHGLPRRYLTWPVLAFYIGIFAFGAWIYFQVF